jgi:hypothetical protein
MTQPANCPVLQEALEIYTCEQEINRKMRHFRTTLKRCRKCPLDGKCEGLKVLESAIDQALRELTEEWGL